MERTDGKSKKARQYGRAPVRAYLCHLCGDYHVGHQLTKGAP